MSGTNMDEVKEQEVADSTPMDLGDGDNTGEDQKASNENHGNPMPSAQQEEAAIKKKYGGILPKKTPLISKVIVGLVSFFSSYLPTVRCCYSSFCFIKIKVTNKQVQILCQDHERAYFDSADWALGKQGAKPKGPLEALRPKLQPTPHQQGRSRRSAYSRGGEGDDGGNMNISSEDQLDSGSGNNTGYEDQTHHHE
ncbi:uncharacterized protein LOC103950804 isoform X1 [Pyrus x bretschneideri]|uniref:uncharacterized protein LOC103950804 isoform X1 n=1 Tax=Pyrus x bretschneideri TaxID=225117 RepID=UPI00202E0F33|nr:uncharacterized protein LOC103950804 isoform X1 [Pyrus x bretschneideri]